MRKTILMSLAAATMLGALASPTLAQQAGGRGESRGGRDGGGEYRPPVTHVVKKRFVIVAGKGGEYCSTNWKVLFTETGRRTKVRHCDWRNEFGIN